MAHKPVSQINQAGLFVCVTLADDSPLEPGVWLMPAGTVDAMPPGTYTPAEDPGTLGTFEPSWPADRWPRWNGVEWQLINRPQQAQQVQEDPIAKLQAFLAANPDVAALLQQGGV